MKMGVSLDGAEGALIGEEIWGFCFLQARNVINSVSQNYLVPNYLS